MLTCNDKIYVTSSVRALCVFKLKRIQLMNRETNQHWNYPWIVLYDIELQYCSGKNLESTECTAAVEIKGPWSGPRICSVCAEDKHMMYSCFIFIIQLYCLMCIKSTSSLGTWDFPS